MRRPVLVTLVVLGSLISLLGSTGLFAALTDTAETGVNSVDSAALASSADIQLAEWSGSCGAFSENLSTALITASDVTPGDTMSGEFCIRNVGSQSVNLSTGALIQGNFDPECTGDEAIYDETCGGDLAGELGSNLAVQVVLIQCGNGELIGGLANTGTLSDMAVTPINHAFSLGEATTACFSIAVAYPASTADDAVQMAQSDLITWKFVFIADALS